MELQGAGHVFFLQPLQQKRQWYTYRSLCWSSLSCELYLVERSQSVSFPPLFKCIPIEVHVSQHLTDTTIPLSVAYAKASSFMLDTFKFVYPCLCPYSTGLKPASPSQVGKSSTFLIFPQILINFSYFSSNFSHFLPQISSPGGQDAHPGRPWLRYWYSTIVLTSVEYAVVLTSVIEQNYRLFVAFQVCDLLCWYYWRHAHSK